MELKKINLIEHNNKRVREEKTNTRIFTWFGNLHLRPHLQADQAWRFHYPSLPRLQMLTIDFQSVNEPLQQRDYLSISSHKSSLHLYTHKFDEKNEDYNENPLLEWIYK